MNTVFPRIALAVASLALAAGTVACEPETSAPHPGEPGAEHTHHDREIAISVEGDRWHNALRVVDGTPALRAELAGAGAVRVASDDGTPIRRAGLRWDTVAGGDAGLEYRTERAGTWSAWHDVIVTWNESVAFNGLIELDTDADTLEVRPRSPEGSDGELGFLLVETYPEPLVAIDVDAVDRGAPKGEYLTGEYAAVTLPGFVVPRAEWGATNTGLCGDPTHTPTYLTVHHTVTPTNDSVSPEVRLRGIQNYHANSNGWCDIGYHFLVDTTGRMYQGRDDHEHRGVHVGGNNTNNIGISFMGSFHIDQVPDAMIEGTAPLFAYFRDTYGISLQRNTTVFGHREWGNQTSCPGDFLLPRLQEIIDLAEAGDTEDHVAVDVVWSTIQGQARDLVAAGSSNGIFDALVGQRVQGSIVVYNGADRPATDDMILGYWIESPYWEPLGYTIQTSSDGQSWSDSGENGRSDNPDPDAMPAEGFVRVGSVAPGQWVRLLIDVRAARYSIGRVDHPDLRGWVKHIGSYYGEQDGWNDDVEVNQAGELLRDYAQADIFASDEWGFDGGDGDDLEGWTVDTQVSDFAVNIGDGAMAMKASGADPRVLSPAWTAIDADRTSTVVIRARQHGGLREAQLFWAKDGEGFAEERSITFQTPGDGEFGLYELELAGQPGWDGTITRLRLDPWDGGPYEAAAAWFDVDYILAVAGEDPVVDADNDGSVAEVDCNDADPEMYPGADEVCDGKDNNCNGETDEGCTGDDPTTSDATMGTDTGTGTGLPDATSVGPVDGGTSGGPDMGMQAEPSDGLDPVDSGCCTTVRQRDEAPAAPLGIAAAMLLGLGLVARRRRR